MTRGLSERGERAERLGQIGERTFGDQLLFWTAGTHAPAPSSLVPDSQKVDWQMIVPSLWYDVEQIPFRWQVKATAHPRVVTHGGVPCFRIRLEARDVAALRESARYSPTLLLAYGVVRYPVSRPEDLLSLPPLERFDWYAIDLEHYFRSDEGASDVYVPIANRLNLATFSLLWAGHWVARFFAPLYDEQLTASSTLGRYRDAILLEDQRILNRIRSLGWDFHTTELPRHEADFDPEFFRRVNFRLGLGAAFTFIRDELRQNAGRLTQIRTYCPEALFGTANLWLFAAVYHRFMEASRAVATGSRDFVNQRLLPIDVDLEELPPMVLANLWHVVLLYRVLGADVRIVRIDPGVAGEDHSYYGGGIGYFPWVSLSSDQTRWEVMAERRGSIAEHIDFLVSALDNEVIGPRQGVTDIDAVIGPGSQLELPAGCPRMLFPAQTVYLEYPLALFDRRRVTAAMLGGPSHRTAM